MVGAVHPICNMEIIQFASKYLGWKNLFTPNIWWYWLLRFDDINIFFEVVSNLFPQWWFTFCLGKNHDWQESLFQDHKLQGNKIIVDRITGAFPAIMLDGSFISGILGTDQIFSDMMDLLFGLKSWHASYDMTFEEMFILPKLTGTLVCTKGHSCVPQDCSRCHCVLSLGSRSHDNYG